jgi:hypothetical protein
MFMKRTALALALILALLSSAVAGRELVDWARANPNGSPPPNLSMPKEYINYSITSNNGSLWAKVNGKYPITILTKPSCSPAKLPMVYPAPPGTTNIHITLNGTELSWSNYTQTYPDALHHTAIGDWTMIHCVIENISDTFLLEIQYEHPIQQANGTYVFLYDLNISPYLSPQSLNSTAYFTIKLETNASNLQMFTTKTDTAWNTINYTTEHKNSTAILTAQIHSEYSEPLLGDLAVTFNVSSSQEFLTSFLIASAATVAVIGLGVFAYFKKYKRRN